MTVTATSYTPIIYNGNGSTSVFTITFQFYEIAVIHIDSSGAETEWVEKTHYKVTGGEGAAGSVTVITTVPTIGEKLRIERRTVKSQVENFDLDNEILENSLQRSVDKIAMVMQETSHQAEINLSSVEAAKEAAALSAVAALNSETNASASEVNAITSKDSAFTHSQNAAQSASQSQDSASASQVSADASEASRQAAETLVNNAGLGDLLSTNNLSDVPDKPIALSHLGGAAKAGNLDQFADSTDGSNTISTSGRDFNINGKRALVGTATSDGNVLIVNYANDFEWLDLNGKLRTNIVMERDWPGIELRPSVPNGFGYIDISRGDRPNQDFNFRIRNDPNAEYYIIEHKDANDVHHHLFSLTGNGDMWTKAYGWLHTKFQEKAIIASGRLMPVAGAYLITSKGIGALADYGTGDFYLPFLTAQPDTNYHVYVSQQGHDHQHTHLYRANACALTTSGFKIRTGYTDSGNQFAHDHGLEVAFMVVRDD